jgi:hypothetical protein
MTSVELLTRRFFAGGGPASGSVTVSPIDFMNPE